MVLSTANICAFGWKARDFSLKGVDGKTYSLADVRGPKGTLVVFICNHCPYVKASIQRIVAEAKALREIGIGTNCYNAKRHRRLSTRFLREYEGVLCSARFYFPSVLPFKVIRAIRNHGYQDRMVEAYVSISVDGGAPGDWMATAVYVHGTTDFPCQWSSSPAGLTFAKHIACSSGTYLAIRATDREQPDPFRRTDAIVRLHHVPVYHVPVHL
jgi:hypothetical protein